MAKKLTKISILPNHLLINRSWKPSQILSMADHLDRINLALSSFHGHPEVAASHNTPFEKVWNGDGIPDDRRRRALMLSVLFGSFGFRTLKLRSFGFGVFPSLQVFSNLVFGFRFSFVNNDGGFSDLCIQCILRLFWFCQGN